MKFIRRTTIAGLVATLTAGILGQPPSALAAGKAAGQPAMARINITGVRNLKLAPPPAIGAIVTYIYKSKGRRFTFKAYQLQGCTTFTSEDESGNKGGLAACLPDSTVQKGELTPVDYDKGTAVLFFYQHDIDFDGVDELAIGVHGNDDFKPSDHPLNMSVEIAYFRLINNQWKPVGLKDRSAARSDYVLAQHGISGAMILGTPTVEVAGNTVTIPRNLRGFYYKYAFETGGIIDLSDI
jgi:hypothetical protein